MGQVFVSHSREDESGIEFLRSLFGSVGHEARFYSWDSPRPPHADSIWKNIRESQSLFVLLSHRLESAHTLAWVAWEVGVATGLGKPVWVLEHLIAANLVDSLARTPVNVPIPGATGYLERPARLSTLRTEPYYSLVKDGGLHIPVGPDGNMIPNVTCPNPKCQALFRAYFVGPLLVCPVCRQRFRRAKWGLK